MGYGRSELMEEVFLSLKMFPYRLQPPTRAEK
jgi:hypothetical protein